MELQVQLQYQVGTLRMGGTEIWADDACRYEEALADLGLDDDGTPMRMQVLDEDGVMNPWTLDKESSVSPSPPSSKISP